ncbi:MAG: NAD(P)-binding protein [Candidatus Omnitrophota bacterium]
MTRNIGSRSYECCIIGAGPAGLGAALELVKNGVTSILIVDKNTKVGGLARTEVFDGVRFDLGPHRFFTKNNEVNKIWHDTLGRDFRPVSRLTRILYKNKYFNYPIKPIDALIKLGPIESFSAILSFMFSQLNKKKDIITFEDWVTQRFGKRLYEIFFKTYTEKVWGISCDQISAEWAGQRIKGLDVFEILKNSLFGGKDKKIRTLVEEFDFPVLGAGQMYETICDKVISYGAETMLSSQVIRFNRHDNIIGSIDVLDPYGQTISITSKQFFSSIPLAHFFNMLYPEDSQEVRQASGMLRYRDHITVDLLVEGEKIFPDQWIYVHSPEVQMARIANYNNFSKAMVGKDNKTALSIEYFVFKEHGLWNETDRSLIEFSIAELEKIGLIKHREVEKAWVVRETEAYPINYLGFQEHYDLLKARLSQFINLCSIGRAGMHKYNNQDHSILSGVLAARNYLKLPGSPYSLWNINMDAEYQENGKR